jgi:hypothetical protein
MRQGGRQPEEDALMICFIQTQDFVFLGIPKELCRTSLQAVLLQKRGLLSLPDPAEAEAALIWLTILLF